MKPSPLHAADALIDWYREQKDPRLLVAAEAINDLITLTQNQHAEIETLKSLLKGSS